MPLHFILGTPGSGKSYYCVMHWILNEGLRKGRKVITNIPINTEHLTDEELELFEYRNPLNYKDGIKPFSTPEEFMDEWRSSSGECPLYVIDECQEILAREARPSLELLEFIAKHRHYGEMDIVLISQGLGYIHQRIKLNLETTTVLTKRAFLGHKNSYNLKLYGGQRERGKPPVTNRNYKYDKEIFKFYKSHTESKKEVERTNHFKGNSFLKWFVRSAIFILLLAGYTVFKTGKDFKDNGVSIVKDNNVSVDHEIKRPVEPQKFSIPDISTTSVVEPVQSVPVDLGIGVHSKESNINYYLEYEKREEYQTYKEVKKAAFYNFRFVVVSSIESKTKKMYTFSLTDEQRGVTVSQTNIDLEKLGYRFEFLTPCVVLVDHLLEHNAFYATCEKTTFKALGRKRRARSYLIS